MYSSSVDCPPESPTLPPDMAQDEGFTDVANGDELKLGQPETSPYIAPSPFPKHNHIRSNQNYTNTNLPATSDISGQTTCKFIKKKEKTVGLNSQIQTYFHCIVFIHFNFFFNLRVFNSYSRPKYITTDERIFWV